MHHMMRSLFFKAFEIQDKILVDSVWVTITPLGIVHPTQYIDLSLILKSYISKTTYMLTVITPSNKSVKKA